MAAEKRSLQSGNAAYSTNRHTVLKRAAKRARRGGERARTLLMEQDLPALGIKPIDQWSPEELARGKPRNPDGTWSKNIPRWLTSEVQAEIDKRFRQATGQKMNVAALEGILMARKLMRRASSESVRLDASKFFIEQVFGKAVQKVDVQAQLKVEQLLGVAIVNPDGSPAYGYGDVLDAPALTTPSTDPDEDDEDESSS